MASLSKESVKKSLEKGDYRTCDKPPQAKALWWSNFKRIQDQMNNLLPYVQCIRCKHLLTYDSKSTGTRSLSSHAQSCKAISSGTNHDIERMLRKTSSISSETKRSFLDACVKFCSQDMRPFEIVKGEGFKNLCQTLLDLGRRSNINIQCDELIPDPIYMIFWMYKEVSIDCFMEINDEIIRFMRCLSLQDSVGYRVGLGYDSCRVG